MFYYAKEQAFKGIINQKDKCLTLWLTDYRYLNGDDQEGKDIFRIFTDVCMELVAANELDQFTATLLIQNAEEQLSDKDTFLYPVKDALGIEEKVYSGYSGKARTFVCCGSELLDCPDLWQRYANDVNGVCMYIREDMLAEPHRVLQQSVNDKIEKCQILNVVYSDDIKKAKIRDEILRYKRVKDQNPENSIDAFVSMVCWCAKERKYQFKRKEYEFEQERRLVLTVPVEHIDAEHRHWDIKTRTNEKGESIPYISVNFDISCLHAILLPKNATDEKLREIKSSMGALSRNIIIEKSKCFSATE